MWQELLPHNYTPYIYVVIIMYICFMENKRRFIQEHLSLDFDSPDYYYLIIVEVEGYTVITSYVVKVPSPYLSSTINPYCKN